jgi:uncharacterized protein with beta-barrel porin domain
MGRQGGSGGRVGLSDQGFSRSRLFRRHVVLAAAAILFVVAAVPAANAACTPPAVNATNPASGTTVTCSGTTANQNGTDGYGSGNQTGITINVNGGGTVTGSGVNGIFVGDATVSNLGSISGGTNGINAALGSLTVTNSGSIAGFTNGILSNTGATVTNNAGGSITAHTDAIYATSGPLTVDNSGAIQALDAGVRTGGAATVVNRATGNISGPNLGIVGDASVNVTNFGTIASSGNIGVATAGIATVVNYGSISGGDTGIFGNNGVMATNNAGASIGGTTAGIRTSGGGSSVFNAGSIAGTTGSGILTSGDLTLTNNVGATISGHDAGVSNATGLTVVTNSGSIAGFTNGILSNAGTTVTNNAGGSITAHTDAIYATSGPLTVDNSGTIQALDAGIRTTGAAIVVNSATGSISSANLGVAGDASVNVTNFGNIASSGNIAVATVGIATVVNYGSIGGVTGVFGNSVVVTNNAGASINGTSVGIQAQVGGGSSVFNAGSISGGSAAIQFAGSGNTLTLAPGSVISGNVLGTGNDTFQLGGTGTASFDISTLGAAAQYQGFGTFNKIGSSAWTLTGTSTYSGDVNVNGGTLVVNGDLSSAATMMVNPGGTLSGTGTVPFTLLADGATLAPGPQGNATGTLTVNDRLMFCSCSTYAVGVSGTGNDLARVVAGGFGSGDTFLAGLVRVSSPTFSFRFNSAYTILTTQGGLNGTTFDSLQTPSGIGAMLSYTADDVLLTLSSQLAQQAGLNVNQRAVAAALDTAFNANGNSGGLGRIFAGNIPQNLTEASGETATGSQQTSFEAMSLFMGVMTEPFSPGRGMAAPGASQFAGESDANADASTTRSQPVRDAYAMFTKAPVARSYDPRWSTWAAGFGGAQTTDGNAALGSNDVTSRIGGVAVGADYWFSPNTIAGFALAGGATSFNVANGGGGRSDLFQAGAFVRHYAGSAYLSAVLAYGWQQITTDRTVTIAGIDQLHARFNANAFSGRIEAGNRYLTPWMGGIGLTPYAAAQFTTLDLPGYAEQALAGTNAFALNYASKSVTATRSELGLRSDKSYSVGDATLVLRGRTAWAHDYDAERSIAATFQTLPGASFVVNGAAVAHDAALTTASAELNFANGLSLAATFEGEFSNVTRSYAGKGVARYSW